MVIAKSAPGTGLNLLADLVVVFGTELLDCVDTATAFTPGDCGLLAGAAGITALAAAGAGLRAGFATSFFAASTTGFAAALVIGAFAADFATGFTGNAFFGGAVFTAAFVATAAGFAVGLAATGLAGAALATGFLATAGLAAATGLPRAGAEVLIDFAAALAAGLALLTMAGAADLA